MNHTFQQLFRITVIRAFHARLVSHFSSRGQDKIIQITCSKNGALRVRAN